VKITKTYLEMMSPAHVSPPQKLTKRRPKKKRKRLEELRWKHLKQVAKTKAEIRKSHIRP
jgi:hypothetical protein